jgi:hypothetical protein
MAMTNNNKYGSSLLSMSRNNHFMIRSVGQAFGLSPDGVGFFGKVFGFRTPLVFRGQAERLSYAPCSPGSKKTAT